MKSFLVIGLGKFGHRLCEQLVAQGNEVMIVDKNEEELEDLVSIVSSVKIADCANEEVLKSLGIGNFDIVFVCIGNDFQSSLEVTSMVKDMGAKHVISKAERDIHARLLLRNGADEVVYPDRDSADRLAKRCSINHVFDYIELTPEYGIFEISVRKAWVGKSIMEMNFRKKYNANILGIKKDEQANLMPKADHVFEEGEHLIVLVHRDYIKDLT